MYVRKNRDWHEKDVIDTSKPAATFITDHLLVKTNHHNIHFEMQEKTKSQDSLMNRDNNDLPQMLEMIDEKLAEGSDEETIATFVTAAGQQLALYAVEDSDEIFAVAVYDESGEPPTDFQFLMKSDVEKLIGEGAVKTVRKPSQLKQQIYKMDGISSSIDNSIESYLMPSQKGSINLDHSATINYVKKEDDISNLFCDSGDNLSDKNFNENVEMDETVHTNTESIDRIWPNNVYLMIHNDSADIDQREYNELITDEIQHELMEESTVQYILSEDPRDYSDLTLDDIEKVLGGQEQPKLLKCNKKLSVGNENKNVRIKIEKGDEVLDSLDNEFAAKSNDTLNFVTSHANSMDHINCSADHENNDDGITELSKEKTVNILRIKRPRKQQLTIVNRTDSEIIIQPASIIASFDEDENHYENDYHDRQKKKGRHKKRKDAKLNQKGPSHTGAKKRISVSSRNKNARKAYRIEVIDIDIDDLDKEIITLEEDGKEKGSSDKENDVIMVGDSDDETDKEDEIEIDDDDDDDDDDDHDDDDDDSDYHDETSRKSTRRRSLRKMNKSNLFQCQHCNRQYRQKRARDTHSRLCFKSKYNKRKRTGTMRSTRLNNKSSNNLSGSRKKQYECKTCHERFEVVVALARHVRLIHSLKKKITNSIPAMEIGSAKQTQVKKRNKSLGKKKKVVSTCNVKSTQIYSVEMKKNQLYQRTIDKVSKKKMFSFKHQEMKLKKEVCMKKIQCNNCGRWCSSITLLLIHSLKHVTKKKASEKSKNQTCRRCKKTFRSRFLYTIHHLYIHNGTDISKQTNQKSIIAKQARRKKLSSKKEEKLLNL